MKRHANEAAAMDSVLRMNAAAAGIISFAAVAYTNTAARADFERTRELAGNFGLAADTGYELVCAADTEVDMWIARASEKERPEEVTIQQRARTIAKYTADAENRAAAIGFAGLSITDPERENAAQTRPLAAAYGACARAAAVATLLPGTDSRVDEMMKRNLGPFM